jgi:hypothetical protein
VTGQALRNDRLVLTPDAQALGDCTMIIVAVPTPLTRAKEPDLTALESASQLVGRILKPGMMVVYESTVYPGVTEEICLPILERESGMKLGDFALGYSPERVNPGDTRHTVASIVKVVSGHDEAALQRAAAVYGRVITAGVHQASSIRTAEAAKVIENVQRDLNIALMNELSMIFSRMHLNTDEVLDAAATKWNFHRYHPGLVGGHREIGILNGHRGSEDGASRYDAFRKGMDRLGLFLDPAWVREAVWEDQCAYREMNAILNMKRQPTAVFCANDHMAIGAIRAIRERGLRVPEDVSIVGYDDLEAGRYFSVPITTIRPPLHQVGKQSVNLLMENIRDPERQPKQIRFPSELLVRASTGPVREPC